MSVRQNIQTGFMSIKIVLVASDLQRLYGAIKRVNNNAILEARNNPYRNAVAFKNLLLLNINSQKHMKGWTYDKRYKKWKQKTVGHLNFWKLYGHLVKNLTVFPVGAGFGRMNRWMAGITPGVTDKGNTSWLEGNKGRPVLISVYSRWLEFGRTRQPPKPIFTPTTKEYAGRRWLRIGKNSIVTIRRAWR